MFTALIAEDSKPILRNIKALLQSTDLPIRVAATASNGEEALEYIRQQPVDILLTDIRMPKMDGLALIEQAKRIYPQLKVVLISGYNDFEYTRKALNLQVFDYLLKPVERHQLLEVMERIIVQLNERQVSDTEMFQDILDAYFRTEMRLGPDFHDQAKIPLVLRKQPFTPGSDSWRQEFLQECLTKAYAPHACWVFPTHTPQQFLVLVNISIKEKYPSAFDCMDSTRRHLLAHGVHASIGGQLQPVEPGKLTEYYRKVSRLLNEQLSIASPLLLDAGDQISLGMPGNGDMEKLAGSFAEMIRQRQKERFALKLSEQLMKWQSGNIRIAELVRFISVMTDTFSTLLSEQDPWNKLKLAEKSKLLIENDSYADFCKGLLDWAEQCFEMLQAQNRKSGYELFQQIDGFVQMNMYSHVSITDLALKFHVSPSYISRIIKRYSQSTFVHYYMQLKIKEACRLMEAKPDMKIKEVSDALSFSDQHYFSKVFKEYAGCSPTEYKEHTFKA
ncbi:response regulator transcription factor [Cohnella luojiensis]|uniref:Response regulator n=1 Tax=Cohnella luojiensis TaxID=652876 RepID=A0A4Y8LSE1_9BACL|nr:response regulator [Cohnella luojiensis]TFE23212.1 response regulator [Cohnella luojiensis]